MIPSDRTAKTLRELRTWNHDEINFALDELVDICRSLRKICEWIRRFRIDPKDIISGDIDNGEIYYNSDKKFDFQLGISAIRERSLAEMMRIGKGDKFELKSESYKWERTGNICIEYAWANQPSGLDATLADWWAHELVRDNRTFVYLVFPIDIMKALARYWKAHGGDRPNTGDDGKSHNILIPIRDILK